MEDKRNINIGVDDDFDRYGIPLRLEIINIILIQVQEKYCAVQRICMNYCLIYLKIKAG